MSLFDLSVSRWNDYRCWWHVMGCYVQRMEGEFEVTLWNTTHIVSFRWYPYSALKRAFHFIAKHWEVIYQIPEGVFHLISRHREKISFEQTLERVFHPISNHREAILYVKHDSQFFIWYPDIKKSEMWAENNAQDLVIMVSGYRIKDWVECLL